MSRDAVVNYVMNMKLRILVSSDKYKGSLSALEVCNTIKKSIMEIDGNVEVIVSSMADGGEGTVSTLVESQGGKYISLKVTGPLGKPVRVRFGLTKDHTAVIEMASASGLVLVPQGKRNPMETTTYGTGELIKKALDMGCKKVIVGIGGSATNDSGLGMAPKPWGINSMTEKVNCWVWGERNWLIFIRLMHLIFTNLFHSVSLM